MPAQQAQQAQRGLAGRGSSWLGTSAWLPGGCCWPLCTNWRSRRRTNRRCGFALSLPTIHVLSLLTQQSCLLHQDHTSLFLTSGQCFEFYGFGVKSLRVLPENTLYVFSHSTSALPRLAVGIPLQLPHICLHHPARKTHAPCMHPAYFPAGGKATAVPRMASFVHCAAADACRHMPSSFQCTGPLRAFKSRPLLIAVQTR